MTPRPSYIVARSRVDTWGSLSRSQSIEVLLLIFSQLWENICLFVFSLAEISWQARPYSRPVEDEYLEYETNSSETNPLNSKTHTIDPCGNSIESGHVARTHHSGIGQSITIDQRSANWFIACQINNQYLERAVSTSIVAIATNRESNAVHFCLQTNIFIHGLDQYIDLQFEISHRYVEYPSSRSIDSFRSADKIHPSVEFVDRKNDTCIPISSCSCGCQVHDRYLAVRRKYPNDI